MGLRPDIQAMRGFAVLVVVLFHARLGIVDGGYLGVDIFFVISGFLITSMISAQITSGRFRFTEFYFRRAKRLLPAAYVTLLITSALSIWLLTAHELEQFAQQVLGAVTFTANIILRGQGNYFGGDADLKPLLHTWSLSLEEQYYMVMPALLFFVARARWLPLVAAITAISLALCIAVGLYRPDFAFYLFPTRAWELGIGSLGALIVGRNYVATVSRLLFWPAFLAVVLLPFRPIPGLHPGWSAGLACAAALILILRSHPVLNGPAVRPLAWIGDISYSLYLIHWPLFALANNVWVDAVPAPVKLGIVTASVLLAWAQYTFVENPLRRAKVPFSWRRVGAVAAVSAAVVAVPYVALALGSAPKSFVDARRGNTGLGAHCISDRSYSLNAACTTGPSPTELVWGDSYAMHLLPGIVATRGDQQIAQATKYVCGPILDLAPLGETPGSQQNLYWAKGCLAYNRQVLEFIRATPSIRTVVLSTVFKQYVTPEDFSVLRALGNGTVRQEASVSLARERLSSTVATIRAMGRKVVIVAPPPAMDWDAGLCTERRLRNMPTLGSNASCAIPKQAYQSKRRNVLSLLAQVEQTSDVSVIMFDPWLDAGDTFPTFPTGKIWFIANGHLSYQGSVDLARKMHMGDLIGRLAR